VGIADQVVEGRLLDQLGAAGEETAVDGVGNGLGASADS
jgi:hypothetical protein